MSLFGYLYGFFILISGIYTVVVFYKAKPQHVVGEFVSTFLAIWVILAYYERVDIPLDFVLFALMVAFVLYWEGGVNFALIRKMLIGSSILEQKMMLVSSLIGVAPFIYMVIDIALRYGVYG